MLKIEKTVLMSPEQYQIMIEGMRNPKNSWKYSDSYITHIEDPETLETADYQFTLGENDENLMRILAMGGSVHAKYRRMMPVWVTLTAPLYWWKEFDTYKVGTVANSCSTMHKIHSKEFSVNDFSVDHLYDMNDLDKKELQNNKAFAAINVAGGLCYYSPKVLIEMTCQMLNYYRERYLSTRDKKDWWQLIQLLPSSYNQTRTVMLNYEVLTDIYHSRKDHKLDEWHTFCDWIETLPYAEFVIVDHDARGSEENPVEKEPNIFNGPYTFDGPYASTGRDKYYIQHKIEENKSED